MQEKIAVLRQEFKYLSLARKLTLSGSLLAIICLFLPWGTFGVQGEGYEFIEENFHAFQIFPIFGWLILLLSLWNLFLLWREIGPKTHVFWGVSDAVWWLLSGGAGAYTLIIALFVLNSAYLKAFDSQFSLQFGIFLVLFAEALVLLAGLLGRREEAKDYLKAALSHPHQMDTSQAHLSPEPLEERQQMSLGDYE